MTQSINLASAINQLKTNRNLLISVAIVVSLIVGSTLIIKVVSGVPMRHLTRDLASLGGLPPYAGMMSLLGIIVWAASLGLQVFAVRLNLKNGDSESFRFFSASAAFTLFLLLDDAFQMHEIVLPGVGIPQFVVYLIYCGTAATYLLLFSKKILKTDYLLLAIALGLFASSILLDLAEGRGMWWALIEDTIKITGISFWFAYYLSTAEKGLLTGPTASQ